MKKSTYIYSVPTNHIEIKMQNKERKARADFDYGEYKVENPMKIVKGLVDDKDTKAAEKTTDKQTIETQEPTLENLD